MSWYEEGRLWCFVGGIAAAAVAGAMSKSPAVRSATVKTMASGMMAQENAQAAMQSMKDDAEDICAESREKAKHEAAIKQRAALIEERVKKQVEEELEAEEKAEAEKQAKSKSK